jgi:hypothetical protein
MDGQMSSVYQSPGDKMRYEILVKSLIEGRLNLAVLSESDLTLDFYANCIHDDLRARGERMVEFCFSADSAKLVEMFNGILSELTVSQARDKQVKSAPKRYLIFRDIMAMQEFELQLLARLVNGFPASNINVVLLVNSSASHTSKLQTFGKNLLSWEVEGEPVGREHLVGERALVARDIGRDDARRACEAARTHQDPACRVDGDAVGTVEPGRDGASFAGLRDPDYVALGEERCDEPLARRDREAGELCADLGEDGLGTRGGDPQDASGRAADVEIALPVEGQALGADQRRHERHRGWRRFGKGPRARSDFAAGGEARERDQRDQCAASAGRGPGGRGRGPAHFAIFVEERRGRHQWREDCEGGVSMPPMTSAKWTNSSSDRLIDTPLVWKLMQTWASPCSSMNRTTSKHWQSS